MSPILPVKDVEKLVINSVAGHSGRIYCLRLFLYNSSVLACCSFPMHLNLACLFPNLAGHVMFLVLLTEDWCLSLAARKTCGSEDIWLLLPHIGPAWCFVPVFVFFFLLPVFCNAVS